MTLSPLAPPPGQPSSPRLVHLPRCGFCAGWDGGDEDLGICVFRDRETRRDAVTCPDFGLMPSNLGRLR